MSTVVLYLNSALDGELTAVHQNQMYVSVDCDAAVDYQLAGDNIPARILCSSGPFKIAVAHGSVCTVLSYAGLPICAVFVAVEIFDSFSERISVREGSFKLGALGACSAHGAGLIIYCGVGVGSCGFQIGVIDNFCRVIMCLHNAVFFVTGTAYCFLSAGGSTAGAAFGIRVIIVTCADTAVGVVAVGGPIAPLML